MNALPLLGEIKQALTDLLEKGEPYIIYSNKLPTTLEDRYFLQDVLGKGGWFMYERVMHTKTVAFNTLIPGVWIEVVFSERDPKEPILEMVEVDFSPSVFTIPREDMENSLRKFREDLPQFRDYLGDFVLKVENLFEKSLQGEGFYLKNPEGVEKLAYYMITDSELVIENKRDGRKITSTNYYGLWLEYDPRGNPVALHIGNFPEELKPSKEKLKKAIDLLEERKGKFLPKYRNKVDLPLL